MVLTRGCGEIAAAAGFIMMGWITGSSASVAADSDKRRTSERRVIPG